MTNLSIVGQDEVGENQVTRSNVAKTQQPDAERLSNNFKINFNNRTFPSSSLFPSRVSWRAWTECPFMCSKQNCKNSLF